MKKVLYSMTSMLALFVANSALAADGYVCADSRVFTSCGAGWYLDAAKCYECPTGFKKGTGIEGKDNCIGDISAGFYYDKTAETTKSCPQYALYFCPGAQNITYGEASQDTTTTKCYDANNPSAMAVGLKNVINSSRISSLSFTSGLPEGVRVITDYPVVVNGGGAWSYEHCAFDWSQGSYNYKVQIISQNSLMTSGPATLNIVECGSGKLSTVKRVKFSDIEIGTSSNPLYSSGCAGCGEGKYWPTGGTECVDCDIHGKLGLDDSVIATWRSGLADLDTVSFLCPYSIAELPVENGVAKNISCSMDSASTGTYSCSMSVGEEESSGKLGCKAGYILQNVDMDSENLINCGGQNNALSQSVEEGDSPTVLQILTPSALKCVPANPGCYQPYSVDDFETYGFEDVSELIGLLDGDPCGGGNYCDESASVQQKSCPAVDLFTHQDGSAVEMTSDGYADDRTDCYVPNTGENVLYTEPASGNTFYLENKCYYTESN